MTVANRQLTESQRNDYVKGEGPGCPYCGGNDTVADCPEAHGNALVQEVVCSACGAAWDEVYSLTGISEHTPPNDLD